MLIIKIIITTIYNINNNNGKENVRQWGLKPKRNHAQYYCSQVTDWCPAHPSAAIRPPSS